ncbi:MAG: hypothetical protein WCC69_03980 [Pirellulales bacterium]
MSSNDRLPFVHGPWGRGLITATSMLVVSLAVARLPVGVASGGLDSSWGSVLQYAHDHRLHFGSDVVFTYGPLGLAATGHYSGGTTWGATWAGMSITLLFVLPIVLVAKRLPWQQAAALLLLVGGLPLIRACGLDGPVQAGLCCWGILAFTSSSPDACSPSAERARALGLACFVGLIGLAKFSWLVPGGLTVAVVLADAILRGRRDVAALLVATATAVFIGGWSALGQPLGNLPAFLSGSLEIASGYARAMGTRGPNAILLLALLAAGICAGGIVIRSRSAALPGGAHLQARRWLLGGWLSALLFLGWKHGLVRAAAGDTHVTALLTQCVVLAFALPLVPLAAPARDRLAPARCWIVSILALMLAQWMQIGSLEDGISQAMKRISINARVLLRPERHRRWLEEEWQLASARMALPTARGLIGNEPVDVFGYSQDYAIANQLNYTPRPVFQSYSVYTRHLAELNDRFYRSPRSPHWLLFELGSIDGRFPSLEDAHALRTILRDYRQAGEDGRFLVLKRSQRAPIRLELLTSGSLRPGERIDMSSHAARDLWMEIDAAPGPLARLETFVLRPPPLRMRIWREDWPAEGVLFTAPAPMLAAGFIASPVLGSTADVATLLADGQTKRLQALAVETPARARSTAIRYRLYGIVGGLRGRE